jgi:hypothetical protein
MRAILTTIGILMITMSAAFAQIEVNPEEKDIKKNSLYEWTDSNGTVHLTDGFGKVPEQYRSKARKIEPQKGPGISPERQLKGDTDAMSESDAGEADADAKAEWQQRIRDWKSRLANAEKRYQDLGRERNELFGAWGSPALAPIENRVKAEQIDQQMKQVQGEIDAARDMIENVIPEEARKAGVPPGWLRE